MPASDETTPLVLAAWAEQDEARALHAADRAAIAATESARSLVVDRFASGGRDLFNACARLGGLLAEHGGSPSLAAGSIAHATRALALRGVEPADAVVAAASASLLEGYVAAIRESERTAGRARWAYPACVVKTGDGEVAIACGHPHDDEDALAAWAARIAGRLTKANVKRATLSGTAEAKAEVASALSLVGIAVVDAERADVRPPRAGWLRSLLRR